MGNLQEMLRISNEQVQINGENSTVFQADLEMKENENREEMRSY